MTLRSKIYKGAAILTGGQIFSQALSLVRNIIIARLLSPEDMGIAATFAITVTLLEMISNLAVDMLLVQAKDGNDPLFQGTAHLYQVFRGLLVGLVILGIAPIIAWLFDTPQAEWAYRLVALVPVFRGFMHLDWKRLQRNMHYRPAVIVEVIPQAIAALAAFPMAIWLGDYSAVLWIVLMQATAGLLISHVIAQRVYRLNWDRGFASRMVIFGWPLLINGLLMFGTLQGDRIIVGAAYSMAELGVYSVAFSLVLTLSAIFGNISTSLFLPLLAHVQEKQTEFKQRYILIVQLLALISGLAALPFITAGGNLVVLIFGKQYTDAFSFASFLGLLLAVRIFRYAPNLAALARGDTKNSMIANIFRFVGVAAAIVVAWQRLPLSAIIICGIGGELLALMSATYRLQILQEIRIADSLFAPFVVAIILFLAGIKKLFFHIVISPFEDFGICFVLYILLTITGVLAFPKIRSEICQWIAQISGRLIKNT